MSKSNLLFSVVGDNTIFDKLWLSNYTNYDVYISYYGSKQDNQLNWRDKIKYFSRDNGWKFNILNDLYKNNKIDLDKYEYIGVFDDDIVMAKWDIVKSFDLMKKYDLNFGLPSFKNSKKCKIKYDITRNDKDRVLRYTNFIDTYAPIIKSSVLKDILDNYDNELIDDGFNFYMMKNYYKDTRKNAIFDEVFCINPLESYKKESYIELDQLENHEERKSRITYVPEYTIQVYSHISKNIKIDNYYKEYNVVDTIFNEPEMNRYIKNEINKK
jgi:hypothetical protein